MPDDATFAQARLKAAKERAARERAREKARTPEARAKAKAYREKVKAKKATAAAWARTPEGRAATRAASREQFVHDLTEWALVSDPEGPDQHYLPDRLDGASVWVWRYRYLNAAAFVFPTALGWEASIKADEMTTIFSSAFYATAEEAKGWVYDMVYHAADGTHRLLVTWIVRGSRLTGA